MSAENSQYLIHDEDIVELVKSIKQLRLVIRIFGIALCSSIFLGKINEVDCNISNIGSICIC